MCFPPNDTTDAAAAAAAALKEWAREPLWEADEEGGGVLLDRIRARRLEGKAGGWGRGSAAPPAVLAVMFVVEDTSLCVVLMFSLSTRTTRRVLPCSTAVGGLSLAAGNEAVTEGSMAAAAGRLRCVGCDCVGRGV